jgi:hypothetical protein
MFANLKEVLCLRQEANERFIKENGKSKSVRKHSFEELENISWVNQKVMLPISPLYDSRKI